MADTTFWISAALAAIPLTGVIGGFVATYLIAGNNVYISAITTERSKWIEKLRGNLAAYSSALSKVVFAATVADRKPSLDAVLAAVIELNEKAALIQLQLNPRGPVDANILALIGSITVFTDTSSALVDKADRLLIAHSQWLLKAEWERVKYEARGIVYRWRHAGDYDRLIGEYRAFADGPGAVQGLVEEFAAVRAARLATAGGGGGHAAA